MTTLLAAVAVVTLTLRFTEQSPPEQSPRPHLWASPTAAPSGERVPECSTSEPCSLADAQRRVRTMTATMTADIVVNLRGGTYALPRTWAFSSAEGDSGTRGHSVIYQAQGYGSARQEKVVISGGRTVTGWTPHDQARNIWKAPVGELETRQLYVNGVRRTRAATDAGILGKIRETSTGYLADGMAPLGWKAKQDLEFVYGILPSSVQPYPREKWYEPRCPVTDITRDQRAKKTVITMAQPCFRALRDANTGLGPDDEPAFGPPTAIENNYALLSKGTFYLDRSVPKQHVLYYLPADGESLARATVTAPVLESLVTGVGTASKPLTELTFRGLEFADSTWLTPNSSTGFPEVTYNFWNDSEDQTDHLIQAGVGLAYAQRIRFEGNRFTRMGGAGLTIGTGSRNNTVIGNEFTDLSGNGVQVGHLDRNVDYASDPDQMVADNLVSNNYIHRVGTEYRGAYAIWNAIAQRTTITHNELTDLPRGGIASNDGWRWSGSPATGHKITYNHVHDYMKVLGDGGGFDTNGTNNGLDGLAPNSELVGNWFHDDHDNYGQIYLDIWASGLTVRNNVAHDGPRDYHTIGVTTSNTVERYDGIKDGNPYKPCCNQILHNFFEKDPAAREHDSRFMYHADMLVGNSVLPPSAMPASIMNNAGLEPAYRHLLPAPPAKRDNEPPAPPSGLVARALGAGPSVELSWAPSAAADVTGYEIASADTVLAAVPGGQRTVTVTGLEPGRGYQLTVRARDGERNLSGPSNAVSVTTPGGGGLVGRWALNSPTVRDGSGSGNQGRAAQVSVVPLGGDAAALRFNGKRSSVSMGNPQILNHDRRSFTVAATFRTTAEGRRRIVSKGHWGDSTGYTLGYDDGRLFFGIGANSVQRNAVMTVTAAEGFGDGRWHRATAVVTRRYDPAGRPVQTVQMYVDGKAQELTTATNYCGTAKGTTLDFAACRVVSASSNDAFTIGAYDDNADGKPRKLREPFEGAIYDVRIYNRPLQPAELAHPPRTASSSED